MAEPSSAARACFMEAISTHRCTLSAVACGGYFVGGFELLIVSVMQRKWWQMLILLNYGLSLIVLVIVALGLSINEMTNFMINFVINPINFIVTDIAASPIAFRQPVIMNDSQSVTTVLTSLAQPVVKPHDTIAHHPLL
ncbi:hypothetical protein Patl1_14887 [Pistacia atlantica]|uniref:Uncharacterized protein n=1 Tax=Pistacia atlantica TaxID=434234 RepID=A0ACC1AV11_9ROSI|nr:hypothetical protein Patl1_14887 [Pistacia atlantica]